MLTNIDIEKWSTKKVIDWLVGVCDDSSWLDRNKLVASNVSGKELLLMTANDIEKLGAKRVNVQECIIEAIEKLRIYKSNQTIETLQSRILCLSCQARSLHRQLVLENSNENSPPDTKLETITLAADFNPGVSRKKQKVSLITLSSVSNIVRTVQHITSILSSSPFSRYDDYKTMKSLLLALSIELTSTAQRDQFVEKPNDILEKSSKALADYCDRIVYGTRDFLLIQSFRKEFVKIRKEPNENEFGLKIISLDSGDIHVIDQITPLSPAKRTNKLSKGDEILQFNQNIIGWSAKNVEKLIETSKHDQDVDLIVRKWPSE